MITLFAAISKNNCIGKHGDLPWHIPEDIKRMRAATLGKVLIMGRKTWESIPEQRRPLPKRTNVVITRNPDYKVPEGVEVYGNVNQAIAAHKDEEIIGFGGQSIYETMIDIADTLDICHVDTYVKDGNAFFPKIDTKIWKEDTREDRDGYSFVVYKRK